MPMKDGNGATEQQPIQATIDPNAVAQLVHQLQKRDEPKRSRFQEKIAALTGQAGFEQDNINHLTDLIERKAEDLKDELAAKGNQSGAQNMQSRYQEAVSDALEKYTEDDEDLEDAAEFLHGKILSKLSKDPNVMQKFNAGVLDKNTIRALTKAEVEEFSKKTLKRDKTSKGPAIKGNLQGVSGGAALEKSSGGGNISSEEIEELPEHRRLAAKALSSFYRRSKTAPDAIGDKVRAMANREYKRSESRA